MVDAFTTSTRPPCNFTVDTSCCSDWDGFSPELKTAAMEYGAFVMYSATGRRYGLCTQTVRPCGRTCTSNRYGGYYWSEGTWMPYIVGGTWRNCWCGDASGCCTCEPTCQVLLPGPVAAVSGVSQDGVVVPISSWRVDDGQWLVRTDGDCWPECQDYNVNSGTGTFFVTYQVGLPVPNPVARAAGELACEWAKACLGQPCRLPQRIQSVTRLGVSVSFLPIDIMLRHGLTGLDTVDTIIRAYNPGGLWSPAKISSPDIPVTKYPG